ncbi:putative drug resistance transporter [Gordonia hirsuta DSM 44140 = NBRC 16056]|uniref:Putative drug resistance transporter n=1 Tax=Gordonia hirsuta DSM 44140 = NBRC 16056 TaxID=1121927 RepID=L7LAU9_9ACTN|nr:DHA2 family efflux MFS transporter permease subunit [Gordonia hirsuta]GAC57876.1 putative drug resistance transporter [Gordonia hirsuta DSM 44140 = NBRC 16056]
MTQATPATGPEAAPDKLTRDVLVIAGVVVLGAIMSILDVTVVAVAQVDFMLDFDVSNPATVAWTMTGYTLALAAVIPTAGWAASRFGTRNVYLVSLVLFLLGSLLCALADSIGMLVAFRMIQGLGGGLLMPIGMMIMTRAAGPERVGSVMAVLGIPMLLGPIAGPILGGWLIDIASWHWIFLINIPLGLIAMVYAWMVLPRGDNAPGRKLDVVGLLLLSPGLAMFLFGVSSSAEKGTFNNPQVYGFMIAGGLLIAAFIAWALRGRVSAPLLDLRLFANRTLTVSVITLVFFAIAFFGAGLLYPQYFQLVGGQSPMAAGLLLAPQGLGAMLTMPIAGKLTDKMGPGLFVLGGLVLILIGVSIFTTVGAEPNYVLLCSALFVQGLGMGMTMMPIMSSALASLRGPQVADGSTMLNAIQQTAASIGTAVITVIFTGLLLGTTRQTLVAASSDIPGMPKPPAELVQAAQIDAANGFGTTFIVAAALVACCFIPAFFLPRTKVAGGVAEEGVDLDGGSAPVIAH